MYVSWIFLYINCWNHTKYFLSSLHSSGLSHKKCFVLLIHTASAHCNPKKAASKGTLYGILTTAKITITSKNLSNFPLSPNSMTLTSYRKSFTWSYPSWWGVIELYDICILIPDILLPVSVTKTTKVLKKKVLKCLQVSKVVYIGILIPATLPRVIADVVKVVYFSILRPATIPQVIADVVDVFQVWPSTLSMLIA